MAAKVTGIVQEDGTIVDASTKLPWVCPVHGVVADYAPGVAGTVITNRKRETCCSHRDCYKTLRPQSPKATAAALQLTLPTDSASRKAIPLCTGVFDYFPAALAEIAKLSKAGNDKHNPGQHLHWSQDKSNDHADCILKHMVDRGLADPEDKLSHTAKVAWRALALLQMECQERGAPVPRGAR